MAGNLSRFNPFADVARFDPMRSIEEMMQEFGMAPWRGKESAPMIKMDVSETEKDYTVKAEIPGCKKEDITVSIDGNVVSIRAETKSEHEESKNGSLVRSERYYGQQYRSFTLSQEVDDAKAEARYADGVLELRLPKKPGTGGRQISIQ